MAPVVFELEVQALSSPNKVDFASKSFKREGQSARMGHSLMRLHGRSSVPRSLRKDVVHSDSFPVWIAGLYLIWNSRPGFGV